MFKSIASFFNRLTGAEQSNNISSQKSSNNTDNDHKEKQKTSSTVIVAQSEPAVKVINTLPELPAIDTLLEFVKCRTITFEIPKNTSDSFLLRPIIPSDRNKMHSALNNGDISTNSLFMRFTNAKKTFTERELDYFTRLDFKFHNGIGVVLNKPGYPGIGTSRYFVDRDDPTMAEWAVTVVDKYHGQGIGVVLFYAICVLAEVNGIKRLKAVINGENRVVFGWINQCNAYEIYEDQSPFFVINLPIPEDFFRNKPLAAAIRDAVSSNGNMNNATVFATTLELKQFYDDLEAKDSDDEDFTVTCSSYDDDSRSRVFTSNNHLLCEMMDEISISSRSNSIDDFDFDF